MQSREAPSGAAYLLARAFFARFLRSCFSPYFIPSSFSPSGSRKKTA